MATIIDCDGSIFDSGADVLVCPVNCVGVMGKGLALAFKRRYSQIQHAYTAMLERGWLTIRRPSLVRVNEGQRVVLFATKAHWKDNSDINDVKAGLGVMAHAIAKGNPMGSIAFPALGCGLGGLDWAQVRPLIVEAMAPLDITVMLYAPKEGAA